MSYLNGVTGYREEVLQTRSIIKKDNYALIEPDGVVKNVIPGFEGCEITILASPKLGASFVDYLVAVEPGGKNDKGFGNAGEEIFFYVFEGNVKVWNEKESAQITDGGYIFCPEGTKLYFENIGNAKAKCFLYKRLYDRIEGYEAHTVIGNINDVDWMRLEDMEDVLLKDFLPAADNLGFDMNFHILAFKPGACHGYVETHIQEHGAYIYSGEGMYLLDSDWVPVKKGDYIFMSAYCPQAAYAVGRSDMFAYIYSKDWNRDIKL